MRNLHKYYYKDYFSRQIPDIDGHLCLSFEYMLWEEEKKKETDKAEQKRLLKKIDNCKKKNALCVEKRNDVLTGSKLWELQNDISPSDNRFSLQIIYPGLVTGVGINHETKIEGEFKLGVHFDWTRGMPVVYGSSVKGVLRAWFKEFYNDKGKERNKCNIDGDDLLMDIFSGAVRDVEAEKKQYEENWTEKVKDTKKRIYKPKSIYDRDIFFDAVIVKADPEERILAPDSITPHGDNPLKNPTPLTFLKIASGCTMEFRFKLVDSVIDGKKFAAAQKKTLFEEILKTVGVGAKTNVGYGQMKNV